VLNFNILFQEKQILIKGFVSDLRQVGGFSGSSTNKTDHHDITEILLKVALNTIKQNNNIDQRMNKKHGMQHTNTFY
jgi:hypothetical protein